jgi:hypothetical protein
MPPREAGQIYPNLPRFGSLSRAGVVEQKFHVTNATTGAVSSYMAREPVATNLVVAVVTNFVPVFFTNVVQVVSRRRAMRRGTNW